VKRGDLYRVRNPSADDPKRSRVFVVVSRQTLINSRFSTTPSPFRWYLDP